MPKWGLPPELSATRPWGLDPRLLEPDKTNTDPIHDDIYLNRLERRLCDCSAFQRLRRIRQLGTAHLVFPGATHTRFQHSLGTMRVAQDLFDHVVDNPTNRDPETNLLGEWRAEGDESFRRKLAEAQVLARLGALLHDFCHVPYGHTLEDDFKLLVRHDANEERFEFFWATVDDDLRIKYALVVFLTS